MLDSLCDQETIGFSDLLEGNQDEETEFELSEAHLLRHCSATPSTPASLMQRMQLVNTILTPSFPFPICVF